MLEHIQKRQEELRKEILDSFNTIEKGGEGSRGGKVIGHTRSGKPVYASKSAQNKVYHDFSEEDHEDAYELHDQAHSKGENNGTVVDHFDRAWSHQQKTKKKLSNSSSSLPDGKLRGGN